MGELSSSNQTAASPQKRRGRHWLKILLGLVVLTSIVIVVLTLVGPYVMWSIRTRSELEKWIGVELPPKAKNVSFSSSQYVLTSFPGIEVKEVNVYLELPASPAIEFMTALLLDAPEPIDPQYAERTCGSWNNSGTIRADVEARTVIGLTSDTSIVREMLINQSDPDQWIICLNVFERHHLEGW